MINCRRGSAAVLFMSSMCVVNCGSENSELIYEDVVIQLPTVLNVTTRVLGNSCGGPSRQATGTSTTATIVQDGNNFSWSQIGVQPDSAALKFLGRICPLGTNGFELRMRSEAIIRVPEDDGFCRTTLRAPRAFGQCGEFDDLCDDEATIRMSWDECSGTFNGQFAVRFSYTEACVNVNECFVNVLLSGRLPTSTYTGCAEPAVIGDVNCGTAEECVCQPAD